MSKKTRGFQPGSQPGSPPGQPPAIKAGSQAPAPHSTSSRAAYRRQVRARPERTGGGSARYRNILMLGIALVGVGIVAVFLIGGTSAARYQCDSLLTPPPATSADAGAGPLASAAPSPQLGFVTTDMGRGHAANGSTLRFAFCPPTSGEHWNVAGRAPLRRDVYGPNDDVSPGNWVHNLEHGYVIIAYRDALDPKVEAGIREVFDTAAQGPVAAQCGLANKVVAVQFDDMSEPYAVLAWDRAMLMPEWDTQAALTFANQWQESPQQPEPSC